MMAITKQEAEKFMGQLVALTIAEDDDEFLGVGGTVTKVTDNVIELDNGEDNLCTWKLNDVDAIELLNDEWNQPFAWIRDVR